MDQLIQVKTKYGDFLCPTNDNVIEDLLENNFPTIVDYINEIVGKQQGCLVDIGSHIGAVSIPVLKSCRNLKVVSFEPQSTFSKLQKDISTINGLQERIVVYTNAVGHKDEPVTLERDFRCADSLVGMQIPVNYTDKHQRNFSGIGLGIKGENVQMVSLDMVKEHLPRDIKWLKISTEGTEKLIIYGAKMFLQEYKPTVLIKRCWKKLSVDTEIKLELTDEIKNFPVDTFMSKIGYKPKSLHGDYWIYLPNMEKN